MWMIETGRWQRKDHVTIVFHADKDWLHTPFVCAYPSVPGIISKTHVGIIDEFIGKLSEKVMIRVLGNRNKAHTEVEGIE